MIEHGASWENHASMLLFSHGRNKVCTFGWNLCRVWQILQISITVCKQALLPSYSVKVVKLSFYWNTCDNILSRNTALLFHIIVIHETHIIQFRIGISVHQLVVRGWEYIDRTIIHIITQHFTHQIHISSPLLDMISKLFND